MFFCLFVPLPCLLLAPAIGRRSFLLSDRRCPEGEGCFDSHPTRHVSIRPIPRDSRWRPKPAAVSGRGGHRVNKKLSFTCRALLYTSANALGPLGWCTTSGIQKAEVRTLTRHSLQRTCQTQTANGWCTASRQEKEPPPPNSAVTFHCSLGFWCGFVLVQFVKVTTCNLKPQRP